MYTSLSSGFPASGKIRENLFLLESQGKSGNFVESQGKSGNFTLPEVNPVSTMISMHFFLQPDFARIFFASLRSAFQIKISTLKSGKVREKPHEKVRECQGIVSELPAGNPEL